MNIGKYSLEEYQRIAASFHGYLAPGLLIGGIMVDRAMRELPQQEGLLFDSICETAYCLPDAIQLLTPCTYGNGWLKVIETGRFALTLYDKVGGKGVRVFLDASRLEQWEAIKEWFLKLKPKKEQDSQALTTQILDAGNAIYGTQNVTVSPRLLVKRHKGAITLCPACGEAYPREHGPVCRGCQGEPIYLSAEKDRLENVELPSFLVKMPVEKAVGQHLLHDMTMIEPGKSKGPAFKRGQTVSPGDLCRLQSMGRQNLYCEVAGQENSDWVHENEVALAFVKAMAGEGATFTETPKEGRCDILADRDGLLVYDEARLEAFNMVPQVMCASRTAFSLIQKGEVIAGTRAIPLYLQRTDFQRAMALLAWKPLFTVMPIRPAKIGLLITGTEVFQGLIEDKFEPIIKKKAASFGCEVIQTIKAPDDSQAIRQGAEDLLAGGIDLLITTAGLSVDPDDVTRQALIEAGARDLLYSVPVLPGSLLLLGRIGKARLMGVPACALYFSRTSFDLIFPRVLAGCEFARSDLAKLGSGGLCLQCKTCSYPHCAWGGR